MNNLENYGVWELSAKEVKSIDGGIWGRVATWLIEAVIIEAALNPVSHYEAASSGWQDAMSY